MSSSSLESLQNEFLTSAMSLRRKARLKAGCGLISLETRLSLLGSSSRPALMS